jgi:hypothetical protein
MKKKGKKKRLTEKWTKSWWEKMVIEGPRYRVVYPLLADKK